RAGNGVHNRAELDNDAVAHLLDDAPVMLAKEWLDDFAPQAADCRQRARLVLLDEPRIADDVSGENCRPAPLDHLHGRPPQTLLRQQHITRQEWAHLPWAEQCLRAKHPALSRSDGAFGSRAAVRPRPSQVCFAEVSRLPLTGAPGPTAVMRPDG